MNAFSFYFPIGWEHIISLKAMDHLLFIMALAALYVWTDWKKVLILITAFTIGHSVTLVLAVLDLIRLNNDWVEFFIPVTIMITAFMNLLPKSKSQHGRTITYWLALFFGFIHGMGFANSIRFMLAQDQSLGWGLLGFNFGLEAGQLVVVIILLSLNQLILSNTKITAKGWTFLQSSLALGIATAISINRFPLQF